MHTRADIAHIRARQSDKRLEAPSTKAFAAQKELEPLCQSYLELLDEVEALRPQHVPGLIKQLQEKPA